jgi:carbon-monoxide dehydrogenase large subunit
METRNAIGLYDPDKDFYTLYSGNQGSGGPARQRLHRASMSPEEKMRVVNCDVGGGFGMKGFPLPRAASRPDRGQVDRPAGSLDLRSHRGLPLRSPRPRHLDEGLKLPSTRTGKILAVRVTGTANMGGYLSAFAPFIPTLAGGRILGGVYRVPALYVNIKGYYTNTAPVNAYRGAGRPEAAHMMERLMDSCAAKDGHRPHRDPAAQPRHSGGASLQELVGHSIRQRRLSPPARGRAEARRNRQLR